MRRRSISVLLLALLFALPLPAAAEGPSPIKLLGQTGGASYAVAVEGSLAALGVGPGLTLLDVSDPTAPAELGHLPLPDLPSGIVLAGSYVYVADGSGGLRIVDVSDPAHPAELGAYPGIAQGACITGTLALIAAGAEGLDIVNIADPTHPQLAGHYDLPGEAHSVAVRGDFAYLACGAGGLRVVDISDPADPWRRGIGDTQGLAEGVAIAWPYAYVTSRDPDGPGGYLQVFDVSNPADPRPMGEFGRGLQLRSDAYAVTVSDHYAYIAAGHSNLQIIDVSDPAHLVRVFFIRDYDDPARDVCLVGPHAYVASPTLGLRVFDVSEPSQAHVSGAYKPLGIVVQGLNIGRYTYVIEQQGDLSLLDTADPSHPALVTTYPWPASKLAVQGNRAYLSSGDTLRAIDISNPVHPILLGSCSLKDISYINDFALAGRYVYVANNTYGLTIVDVADPSHMQIVGGCDLNRDGGAAYPAEAVQVFGNTAYVSRAGLVVIDVTDPRAPHKVATLPYGFVRMHITGHYAYLTNWNGLRVLDIADPIQPVLVGGCAQGDLTNDVGISGGLVYLSDSRKGLRLFAISDPSQPRELASFRVTGSPNRLHVVGDVIYMSTGEGGLAILHYPLQRLYLPLGARDAASS